MSGGREGSPSRRSRGDETQINLFSVRDSFRLRKATARQTRRLLQKLNWQRHHLDGDEEDEPIGKSEKTKREHRPLEIILRLELFL